MSTKIFHGYKLPYTDIAQLFAWKERLQKKFEATCLPRLEHELAFRAAQAIDLQVCQNIMPAIAGKRSHYPAMALYYTNCLSAITGTLESELREESYKRTLRDDFILSISILFSKTRHGQHTLCLVHNSSRFVDSWFKKHSGATPFPWWNNHDKPDEISDAEWVTRGLIWEAVIGRPPIEAGLAISSREPQLFLLEPRTSHPVIPSKFKRAVATITNCLLHRRLKQVPDDASASTYFNAIRNFDTPVTSKRVSALAQILAPNLPSIPTWKSIRDYPLRISFNPVSSPLWQSK